MTNFAELAIALPETPSPEVSARYSFIDTRKVIVDMKELGYEVYDMRRPKFRTKSGAYGLHEVDFRRPQDQHGGETPRMVFINSYDGSRKAQFLSGVFRFVCSNGLIAGTTYQNEKFVHLGIEDYETELQDQVKATAERFGEIADRIGSYRSTKMSKVEAVEMARRALEIKAGKEEPDYNPDPELLILPRRRDDAKIDLWSRWNVLQENLLRGGIPAADKNGNIRVTRAVTQIQKSNDLNRSLWELLDEFAA